MPGRSKLRMDTRNRHPVYVALAEARDDLRAYLAGQLEAGALVAWAEAHPLRLRGRDEAPADMLAYGQLLDSVIASLLAMRDSEPPEYRTARADIEALVQEIDTLLAKGFDEVALGT
jgi:hypothetical protein